MSIKVLLVEDETEKRALVMRAVLDVGPIKYRDITTVTDLVGAKRCLERESFDLVILDLNIPKRNDGTATPDGGLGLIRWLKGAGRAYRPPYIVAMTAYEEAYSAADSEFDNEVYSVIRFRYESEEWRTKLINTLTFLVGMVEPPYRNDGRFRTDLGIVVALDREMAAVLDLPGDWKIKEVRNDNARYYVGKFTRDGKECSVVAVKARDKGMPTAASVTTKLIYTFRPRFVGMCGICAGVHKDVGMGDAIFADPSWDWGSGKIISENGSERFLPAPYQLRLDGYFDVAIDTLKNDGAWLAALKKDSGLPTPDNAIRVHRGAVTSGGSVMQSSERLRHIVLQHKDLLGLEMEIFGFLEAAVLCPQPQPKAFSVKAVSDFGDERKSDSYQDFAAYVSANILYRVALDACSSEIEDSEN
jgi:nucleoside phosphorylase/CheY-like chemotaxis protein